MAKDESTYELEESSKRAALAIMTELTLKFLLAEVAIMNRNPQEARSFVDRMERRLKEFNDQINPSNSPSDLAWKKEMDLFIKTVFTNISFKEGV